MDLASINKILETKGLKAPKLEALRQDKPQYSVMLFQSSGKVKFSNEFVGNSDSASVESKYEKFLDIAKEQSIHLAITPEYSCPWKVIDRVVNDVENLPRSGALWILGCESLHLKDLKDLPTLEHLVWIYDKSIFDKPGNFVDPVCIIFKTLDSNDNEKWVVVIQFKTHEMGGDSQFGERLNLIKGEKIYHLNNEGDEINLIVLICSDAFNAADDRLISKVIRVPTLLIHIQLNENPQHEGFSEYRAILFKKAHDETEIICLNWAGDTRINESEKPLGENNRCGTALYSKSSKLKTNEDTIRINHSLGMYTTYWKPKFAMAYYCHSAEAILKMRNTNVSQSAMAGAAASRTGPEMIAVYRWTSSMWNEELTFGNNWIREAIDTYSLNFLNLKINGSFDVLNIERFIALSTGHIEGSEWYLVKNLLFFQTSSNEMINRMTCNLDQSSGAKEFRNTYLSRAQALGKGIKEKTFPFPEGIISLKDDAVLSYNFTLNANCNLYSNSRIKDSAPVAYIGDWPNEQTPQWIYDKMLESIGKFERRRLVVWYKSDGEIKSFAFKEPPMIDEDAIESGTSIFETRHPEKS